MARTEVMSIQFSPKMGEPMVLQEQADLIKDKGLLGDRYENGTGAFSRSKRVNVPQELEQDRDVVRDLSMIAEEAIAEANRLAGTDFNFEDTRRNLLVRGIEDLRELIGVVFEIGGVRLLGIEACDPCDRPSKLSGKPGFNEAFQQRGGLRARVLNDGTFGVGDTIEIVDEK